MRLMNDLCHEWGRWSFGVVLHQVVSKRFQVRLRHAT